MAGEAPPAHGIFTRWRAWLQGRSADRTADERDEEASPATRRDPDKHAAAPSLDDVLRDAAQQRDPGDDRGEASAAS